MLCESKPRIGLIGASFFIGILVASTVVPVGFLADRYGRKWVFVITLLVLAIACIGFIFAKTIVYLYVFIRNYISRKNYYWCQFRNGILKN